MSLIIPLIVIFPLFAAIIFNYLHGNGRLLKLFMLIIAISLPLMPIIAQTGNHYFGGHTMVAKYHTGIEYTLGIIQKIMILLLFGITSLVLFSTAQGDNKVSGVYLYLILMGIGATSAIVMVNDIFNLYVFIEIAAICQAGLVIAFGTMNSLKTALKYLLMGSIAGNLFLLGVAMLLGLAGTLNITDLTTMLTDYRAKSLPGMLAVSLMFFGLTYVSGLIPFHNIKASIYSGTRGDASAILQSQAKIIFVSLVIILFKIFGPLPSLKILLLSFGFVGMVIGVIMALTKEDYMDVLGYISVSQAGLIALGIGLLSFNGLRAAVFHTINDILYMSALFLGASLIYMKTGTTRLDKLGGLMNRMPVACILTVLGIIAVSAIPPMNGFQSELRLIIASVDAGFPEIGLMMILVSIGTFVALSRAFYYMFLRQNNRKVSVSGIGGTNTIIAMAIIILACLILGLFPGIILNILSPENIGGWLR